MSGSFETLYRHPYEKEAKCRGYVPSEYSWLELRGNGDGLTTLVNG